MPPYEMSAMAVSNRSPVRPAPIKVEVVLWPKIPSLTLQKFLKKNLKDKTKSSFTAQVLLSNKCEKNL